MADAGGLRRPGARVGAEDLRRASRTKRGSYCPTSRTGLPSLSDHVTSSGHGLHRPTVSLGLREVERLADHERSREHEDQDQRMEAASDRERAER